MSSSVLTSIILLNVGISLAQVRPISELHQNNSLGVPGLLNSVVQIEGIVTVSDQFGDLSFIQDSTGGVGVFDAAFVSSVQIGDTLIITGKVSQNNGLTQLIDLTIDNVIGVGGVPDYVVITAADINAEGNGGVENIEGRLVRLNGASLSDPSGNWPPNGRETASDGTGSFTIFSERDTEIPFDPKPKGSFDIIGVVSQLDTGSPFTSGYEIVPRFLSDIIGKDAPSFRSPLTIVDFGSTWVDVVWTTEDSSFGSVSFKSENGNSVGVQVTKLTDGAHVFRVEGLTASTFYHIRANAWLRADTTRSAELFFLTSSPPESSGEIKVFFNKMVDTTYAISGNKANGNANFRAVLLNRINSAEHSIDLSLYSLSLDEISTALISAKDRGVVIRFVYEDRSTQGAVQTLINDGIQVIKDNFGANDGNGLMHNKFIIFDGRNDFSASNDWVLTGSTNWTATGIDANMQNLILIQDQALAKVYTREFNEMWGSASDIANADSSKFSSNKSDNIPHLLNIGGRRVEVYMSPTDGVTDQIKRHINSSKQSVYFSILSFTRDDISSVMKSKFETISNFSVRGIFDPGGINEFSEFETMKNWGADVYLDTEPAVLHHKYMILDGFNTSGNPVVITGSHNWSTNAETRNNENTLIIYDSLIANLYVQEFAERYRQSSGDTLPIPGTISVTYEDRSLPSEFTLSQNYPNPFNPVTVIRYSIPKAEKVSLVVYNLIGEKVAYLVDEQKRTGSFTVVWDASNVASGIYFYKLHAGGFVQTRKMVLLK